MPIKLNTTCTAQIVEWDRLKGYGWLRVGTERVFLHRRDFIQLRRMPAVGDEVEFTLGQDAKGRGCATNAVFVGDKSRDGRSSGVLLALGLIPVLLFLPAKAALYLGAPLPWVSSYVVGISSLCFILYAHDKRRAEDGGWRVSEARLHALELLGGWPGALLAQRLLRHKSSKQSYLFLFWLIVASHQVAAYDALQGWHWSKTVWNKIEARTSHPR
jgi:uncharacterized membrane protein YsdA (DUF1294 family)/cold shock CspA family protein